MPTIDTSNFWKWVQDRETITYYSRIKNPNGTYEFALPEHVFDAKRRATENVGIASGQLVKQSSLTWHLWRVKLGDIVPKKEDKICDSENNEWIVKSVQVQSYGNRYRLETVKAV